MKLISWNVNGIRACLNKGFGDFFKTVNADIFCIQETKCQKEQVEGLEYDGYTSYWNSAEKKGYSGTAVFTKIKPITVTYGIGIEEHDKEGRVITLEYAKNKKIPIVIATTGFSKEEIQKIEETSKEIPIFRSANMSLDINLMAKILKEVAKVLSNTDIEIIETHHNRKIDSPSGTAILLADAINEVLEEKKEYDFNRMQKREPRKKSEIGFSSIRGGNIVGEHTVAFFGENETLEIKHTSYSRQVFVEGAIKAVRFLITKENGLYDMNDLINE